MEGARRRSSNVSEGDRFRPRQPVPPKKPEAEAEVDGAQLAFTYKDEDALHKELSEFYSYAENADFSRGCDLFEEIYEEHTGYVSWGSTPESDRRAFICLLLDAQELAVRERRIEAAHVLLYLVQGVYTECDTVSEQLQHAATAARLLWECGGLPILAQGLHLATKDHASKKEDEPSASGKPEVKADADMRLYLNLIYSVVELNKDDEAFKKEIQQPLFEGRPLAITLFGMISDFNDAVGKNYPIKKILLLLWKCLLVGLGGLSSERKLMLEARVRAGLAAEEPPVLRCQEGDLLQYENATASRFLYRDSSWKDGLPAAHSEGLAILRKSMYVDLPDLQRDEISLDLEGQVKPPPPGFVPRALLAAHEQTHFEVLYRMLLPNMSRYMIILLKILLAAAPTVKNYTGTMCLTNELALSSPDGQSGAESATAVADLERHKEVIVKAVSAILLLLLTHSRINNIYQQEYLCLLLVDANCILLILKFLNQDVSTFITTNNDQNDLEFFSPEDPGSNSEEADDAEAALEKLRAAEAARAAAASRAASVAAGGDGDGDDAEIDLKTTKVSWRNCFSTMNLLRSLAILTGDSGVRIRTLIRYKAPAILKRLLKIRHDPIRYVTLGLVKKQIKYLGRKWRNSNMKVVTQIYCYLEPTFKDDWLYTDIVDDEAAETDRDALLRRRVEAFNKRNYLEWRQHVTDEQSSGYLHRKTKGRSATADAQGEFEEAFRSYEKWLEQNVFTEEDEEFETEEDLARYSGKLEVDELEFSTPSIELYGGSSSMSDASDYE